MLRVTNQYFWNFVFLVFFVILLVMGTIILDTEARVKFTELSVTDYVLLVLATWQLTQFLAYAEATRFIREQFLEVKKAGRGFQLMKPKTGPRRTISDFFDSSLYLALWLGATLTFFYLLTKFMVFAVVVLAIAGAVNLVTSIALFSSYRDNVK